MPSAEYCIDCMLVVVALTSSTSACRVVYEKGGAVQICRVSFLFLQGSLDDPTPPSSIMFTLCSLVIIEKLHFLMNFCISAYILCIVNLTTQYNKNMGVFP